MKSLFDPVFFNYHFDYEDRLSALLEKFKIHLSLFSVCMHFLRCIRSCERVPNSPSYCKVCSRVVDFHFNCRSSFRNINVTSDGTTLLGLSSDQVSDLCSCQMLMIILNFLTSKTIFAVISHYFTILKKFLQLSHLF